MKKVNRWSTASIYQSPSQKLSHKFDFEADWPFFQLSSPHLILIFHKLNQKYLTGVPINTFKLGEAFWLRGIWGQLRLRKGLGNFVDGGF